ncbi:MAG: hypothetical protein V4510_00330 [bacterium]
MSHVGSVLRSRRFVRIAHAVTAGLCLLAGLAFAAGGWQMLGDNSGWSVVGGMMAVPVGLVGAVLSALAVQAAVEYDGRILPRLGLALFDGALLLLLTGSVLDGLKAMGKNQAPPSWLVWPLIIVLFAWSSLLLATVVLPPATRRAPSPSP